jgi:hypothetical protein
MAGNVRVGVVVVAGIAGPGQWKRIIVLHKQNLAS